MMQDAMPKTYKYYRPETKEWEEVYEEEWKWIAYYNDETQLEQFDSQGIFHQIREIDQSKLTSFQMVSAIHQYSYRMDFSPTIHTLYHMYRVFGFDFMGAHKKVKIYAFGFEDNRTGAKVINVIMPNGELIITDSIDNVAVEIEEQAE